MPVEIERLSISERIQLAEDIWDSILTETTEIQMSQSQCDELDHRLDSLKQHPVEGVSWKSIQANLQTR